MKFLLFIALFVGSLCAKDFKFDPVTFAKLDKECEVDKVATSCLNIGVALNLEHGLDKNGFISARYFEKACENEGKYSGFGCTFIADLYQIKIYNEKNRDLKNYYKHMAKKYYKKACERKSEKECVMIKIVDDIE